QITRQNEQSIYSVTNGKETISEPILYSFGQGKAGQTYVFQHRGAFYESRVSYFKEIQGLDWTIGYIREAPPTIDEAAGRAISSDEARNCFTCHSTATILSTRASVASSAITRTRIRNRRRSSTTRSVSSVIVRLRA